MEFLTVNERAKSDPAAFVAECEAEYRAKIQKAARRIPEHIDTNPIVLLSGPSGSGKTTTAQKLAEALGAFDIGSHSVSLDNYFKTVDPETAPRTEKGEIDYESPYCLDLPLLHAQIAAMVRCERVDTPKFLFSEQRRSDATIPLTRRHNEVVIIEGIHALSDLITQSAGGHGIKLYVSARSNFTEDGRVVFKGTWTRLIRRIVRDDRFRGTRAEFTLRIWDDIRTGEKKFISPFKERADIIINSTHGYEINMLKKHILPLLDEIPAGIAREDEVRQIPLALARFCDIEDALVPKDSLLREFIGGGSFHY